MSSPLRRVLVIDDQADVRTMVSIVLRINHFDVVEAASAAAGLNEFEASKFDLAIVDIFLQGTNGLDVIRKMRERIPDFPIVAISGMTALDFRRRTRTVQREFACESRFVRPNWAARSKRRRRPGPRAPATSGLREAPLPEGGLPDRSGGGNKILPAKRKRPGEPGR